MGAEPDVIDRGPHAGTGRDTFTTRVRLALQLMAELTPALRERVTVFEHMVDPSMPPDRIHPGDERHLAGAFQDNRRIAFEGVNAAELTGAAQGLMLSIIEDFHAVLPAGPRAAKMREVREYLDQTWFCWIGGHQPGDVFYYRIQSPVTLVELDHHCGVFLDYDTPQPFHIHTVLRTPHGNDYGRAYLSQWQERQR